MNALLADRLAEARRMPVLGVASALGIQQGRSGLPCPRCAADQRSKGGDKRPPVGLVHGGSGWTCYRCDTKGDGLDYAAWHLLGHRLREANAEEIEVVLDRLVAGAVVLSPRTGAADHRASRPPAKEVHAFWQACRPPTPANASESERPAVDFLLRRGFGELLPVLARNDLARVVPNPPRVASKWWPRSWAASWRLVVRAFETDGRLASVHVRAVDEALPKTRWPCGATSARLLFACPVGQELLAGRGAKVRFAWICEGLTDWLSLAAIVARDAGADRDMHAVLGATSGGFEALSAVRWPEAMPEIIVCTDADAHGERYADAVKGAVRVAVRRLDLAGLLGDGAARTSPASKVDVNDALVRGVTLDELVAASAAAAPSESVDWEPPIALRPRECAEPFPTDVLPAALRHFVDAAAVQTQTPHDLAGLGVLGALAVVCGGRLRVRAGSHVEPTNLFLYVAMPPASRKSQVAELVLSPLYTIERRLAEEAEPGRREAAQRVGIAQAKLEAARKREAAGKGAADPKAFAELARAADEMVPAIPRLLFDDTTVEKLASVLAEQGGRAAIVSAEGGVWDTLLGRYNRGVGSIDVFLKGHAGDPIGVDRIGRAHEHARRPALTVLSFGQPSRLWEAGAAPQLTGRGMLARILYALPRSTVGWREVDTPRVPDEVERRYDRLLNTLHNALTSEVLVELDAAAHQVFVAYKRLLEPRLRPSTGDLAAIGDWAGKLAGAVLRIAALLHAASAASEGRPISSAVGLGSVEAAIRLGDYLVKHAFVAFQQFRADPATELAHHVLEWIRRRGETSFRARDAFDGVRKRTGRMGETNAALKVLVDHGFIRPVNEAHGVGRPRSPLYEVHPSLTGAE